MRARHGVCSQLGSMSIWLLGRVWRCACALYRVFSRALLSFLVMYFDRASDVSGKADLV
jgi:hypothetical protein